MSSKLLVSRMNSASSLPMHTSAVARRGASSAPGDVVLSVGHLGHLNQPQGFLTSASTGAAPAAAAATSGAGMAAAGVLPGRQFGSPDNDIDPARYHNWEPQTSLLELASTVVDTNSQVGGNPDSAPSHKQQQQQGVNGVAGPLGAHAPAAAGTASAAPGSAASAANTNSNQLGVVSLGTWDAPTGGLWMSGSLAPVSQGFVQGGVQGATPHEGLSPVPAAAAAGSGQPSAVQIRQLQQQQRQLVELQAIQQQLQPGMQQTHAALHAAHMQEHPQLTMQQYVLLRQQQYANQHPQQQQQQPQLRPQVGVPARPGVAGANVSGDASSSGVYLDNNSSSIGLEGSTGATDCSGGGTGSTDAGGVVKPGSGSAQQRF